MSDQLDIFRDQPAYACDVDESAGLRDECTCDAGPRYRCPVHGVRQLTELPGSEWEDLFT